MRPFSVAALAGMVLSASSVQAQVSAPPDLASLLRVSGKALGTDRLASVRGWHLHARGNAAGLDGTFDTWIDRTSGAEVTDAHLPPLSQDQGYDGHAAWTRDEKGVVWVDGSVAGRTAALNQIYRDTYALWTPDHGGASVALIGRRADKGTTYDIIRVTPPGSAAPFEYWFDATTHLPMRIVETIAPLTTTTTLGDYRVSGGVRLAFSQKAIDSQGNTTTLAVDHVDVDPAGLSMRTRKPESSVSDFGITGGTQTSVPFTLVDNHVDLDVMLNGKGPYHFLFDTGGANYVDPAVAREIGAGTVGGMQGGGVGSTTEALRFAKVASMQIGHAELRNQLFNVAPVRAGFGVSGSAPIDGLIGWEVLARFVTTFDYGTDRVTLRMPSAASLEGKVTSFVFGGTQPQMPCALDGITTICAIDTGSRTSLDLFGPFITAHPSIVPANATAPGVNGFGVGGGAMGRLGRLRSVQLGGYDLHDIIAGFSTQAQGAFAAIGVGANVGGGIWKRFVVTFDYPHETMSLTPDDAFNTPDTYDRSGIFAISRGGHLIAIDVRPGTPAADAGIKNGDVIATLDGTSGGDLTLATLRAAFHRPAGTMVRLGVISTPAAVPRDVTLTLRDYV